MEPRLDIDVHFGTRGELVPLVVIDTNHTILGVIPSADEIVNLVVTTLETDIIILGRADGFEIMVIPVNLERSLAYDCNNLFHSSGI